MKEIVDVNLRLLGTRRLAFDVGTQRLFVAMLKRKTNRSWDM